MISKENWNLVKTEARKFGLIHWLFTLLVTLPLAALAAPFYLVGIVCIAIGKALSAVNGFLSLLLPDYNKSHENV